MHNFGPFFFFGLNVYKYMTFGCCKRAAPCLRKFCIWLSQNAKFQALFQFKFNFGELKMLYSRPFLSLNLGFHASLPKILL